MWNKSSLQRRGKCGLNPKRSFCSVQTLKEIKPDSHPYHIYKRHTSTKVIFCNFRSYLCYWNRLSHRISSRGALCLFLEQNLELMTFPQLATQWCLPRISTLLRRVPVMGGASLIAQLVKNPPAIWKTLARSLGWEDPLEKLKSTHFSMLAWRIPWIV